MKLYAVADLHLGHPDNREAIHAIEARPDDWLILAGDVGETERHLDLAIDALQDKFRQLVWVPGNHELWAVASHGTPLQGEARYERFVARCRERGVLTPEDDYPVITVDGTMVRIVPMFLLYDYSFRPPHVALEGAVAWAREAGLRCADESLLVAAPHASRGDWCAARVAATEARLGGLDAAIPNILVNHWPLRQELARLPRIPRFSIWCGTTRTEDWHTRYNARAVVSGHLHMPSSRVIDGVAFEEVSFGYPKQWRGRREPDAALRRIRV
ncbi:metallophosphoesterase [Aurantimonas sp. HBX-1]|uniref:metallophosphoesterase family protein n=1 Tax=Aurantimonas sp. HBX-1 TaxID=2906072 RepID=UPI001F209020|nr:metallophosphoesterase [Aurantimonas sp. HBX-1]UIJ71912.1 metallophosphoesterase [Aurantimonas sp. HBX-1]